MKDDNRNGKDQSSEKKEDKKNDKQEVRLVMASKSFMTKALSLIPDNFTKEDCKNLVELIKLVSNLPEKERESLFNDYEALTPEEVVEMLEKAKKLQEEDK